MSAHHGYTKDNWDTGTHTSLMGNNNNYVEMEPVIIGIRYQKLPKSQNRKVSR